MHALFIIGFMALIGAVIGAFTNYLAIKMLFHPYKAIYLGKRKLPFTPGLIPARQNEMAKQMGKMVTEHLVTSDRLTSTLQDSAFQEKVLTYTKEKIQPIVQSEKTVEEWMIKITGKEHLEKIVIDKAEKVFKTWIEKQKEKTVEEILLPEWISFAETKIPLIRKQIVERGSLYLSSSEGKETIQSFMSEFLSKQPSFFSFVGSFVNQEKVATKAQNELLQLLKSEKVATLIEERIQKEINELKTTPIEKWTQSLDEKTITNWVFDKIPYKKVLKRPLSEVLAPYEEKIMQTLLPKLVQKGIVIASSKAGRLFELIDMEHMVTTQVETFSIERLEEMILGIIKKELHMITILGGVLGGIIGIIQGFFTLLFS